MFYFFLLIIFSFCKNNNNQIIYKYNSGLIPYHEIGSLYSDNKSWIVTNQNKNNNKYLVFGPFVELVNFFYIKITIIFLRNVTIFLKLILF